MSETAKKKPSGRKGGSIYPRVNLGEAEKYAKKLVSKTHTGPQAAAVILPGVFNSKSGSGRIRASALKQFGLLEGTPKAYSASDLARRLDAATDEDRAGFRITAFLNPKLFGTLFATFANDSVSRARIRQQAANLKVHPDSLDDCIGVFISSAVFAGLADEDGDPVVFPDSPVVAQESSQDSDDAGEAAELMEDIVSKREGTSHDELGDDDEASRVKRDRLPTGRANLEIKIDPSMDPEKLEKLLDVLKKYGQI